MDDADETYSPEERVRRSHEFQALKSLYRNLNHHEPRPTGATDDQNGFSPYCVLFTLVTASEYISIPGSVPSKSMLLALAKLRAATAAFFSNADSDALFNQLAPDQRLIRTSHQHQNVSIFASLQSLINTPVADLPKWTRLCFIQRERMVLVWGYHAEHLRVLLADSQTILSELVRTERPHFPPPCITVAADGTQHYELAGHGLDPMESGNDQEGVYKEDLTMTLIPTIRSLLHAIQQYERAGGKVNIIVGDDGLRLLSPEERASRIKFYQHTGISWVARPKHDPWATVPYVRAGKFKLGSNLNNVCQLVFHLNSHIEELQKTSRLKSAYDTIKIYDEAIASCRTVNHVGGNLTMGDILFVMDSYIRVPENLFLDLAAEFWVEPQLGSLDYIVDPMLEAATFWGRWAGWEKNFENVAFKSHAIAGSTSYAMPNAIGHVLRVKVLQAVQYTDGDQVKFWSESLVLERFDLKIRIQLAGFLTKLAQYSESRESCNFKQGISPVLNNHIISKEREAYGTSELVFNPICTWLWRGPFTSLFRAVTMSKLTLASKVDFYRFCATPFLLASSFPVAFFQYLFIGLRGQFKCNRYCYYWKVFLIGLLALLTYVRTLQYNRCNFADASAVNFDHRVNLMAGLALQSNPEWQFGNPLAITPLGVSLAAHLIRPFLG
ncbi:MAG: hypothetical protein Q9200_001360 [Gallowayella weberi]